MKKTLIFFSLLTSSAHASSLSLVQGFSFGTFQPNAGNSSVSISASGVLSLKNISPVSSDCSSNNGIIGFTTDKSWPSSGCTVKVELINQNIALSGPSSNVVFASSSSPVEKKISAPNKTTQIALPLQITAYAQPAGGTYSGLINYRLSSSDCNPSVNLTIAVPVTISYYFALSANMISSMDFGTIDIGNGSGTVRLSTNGLRSVVSGRNILFSGTSSAGIFEIKGEPKRTLCITLPSSAVLSAGGTNQMTINNFTGNYGTQAVLPNNGKITLNIGADLNIKSNQPAGDYTGTYNVLLNY